MLKIRNLKKYYKSKKGENHYALKGLDIDFGDKGFVFILGKSGSGKSTLLNVLGGLDRFDDGEIYVKDKSSKAFKGKDWDSYRNTYLGFVFQDYNIIEEFNVNKNIGLALELQGINKKEIPSRVKSILKQVEMEEYGKRKINELSGGQKQRIAIARALIKNPDIILADEPTGNLDSETGNQILDTLKKLSEDKLVIMVSHDRDDAFKYGDRIIELKDGLIDSDQVSVNQDDLEGAKIFKPRVESYKVVYLKKSEELTNDVVNEINEIIESTDGVVYLPFKKGSKLTKEDVNNLNKYIGDNEIYLPIIDSFDINNAVDKKKFVNSSSESLNKFLSKQSEAFKLIKSKLPLSNTIKMAFSYIWRKKVRLLFSLVLFMASLTMFGFSETVTKFDYASATVLSYSESNSSLISLLNSKAIKAWGTTKKAIVPFENSELSKFFNGYSDFKYASLFDFVGQGVLLQNSSDPVAPSIIKGFLEIDSIAEFDLSLLGGSFPKDNSEIILTDFVANFLIEKRTEYNKVEDLIGTSYQVGTELYVISGILDTDYENYLFINDLPKSDLNGSGEYIDFMMNNQNIYSRIIVKKGFYENYVGNVDGFGEVLQFQIKAKDAKDDWDTQHVSNGALKVSDYLLTSENKEQYLFMDYSKIELKDNEVIVDLYTLANLLYIEDHEAIRELYEDYKGKEGAGTKFYNKLVELGYLDFEFELITMTNNEWLPLSKEKYKVVGVIDFESYKVIKNNNTLYNELIDEDVTFGKYEIENMNRDLWSYNYVVATKYLFMKLNDVGVEVSSEQKYYEKGGEDYWGYLHKLGREYNVSEPTSYDGIWSPIVFSETKFEEITPYSKTKTASLLVKLTDSFEKNVEFMEEAKNMGMRQNTLVGTVLDTFDDFVTEAAHIFRYVSLVLAGFASMLMFTNISSSVLSAKKEIGTLRAIGARGKDVARIFIFEGLILSLFTTALAVVGVYFIAMYINREMTTQLSLNIAIFNVSPIIIIEMLALSLIIAFVASFLPVKRVTIMKPIDAIKNK